jgi:D-alanyl-D-alanine carboxypeptidase
MVVNGLAGEETSSTFAVGVDKIIQMANYNGEQVQETYATPWQHGAVNIEIAGQDFDTYPPSKEQYQRVLQLVTQILVTSNKPVSIVQPHYKEIYMWSSDMPNRLGEQGNWMKLDSYDLKIAKYWDQSSESWLPVSGTSLTYDPDSVQSKVDPGEKFFAKLIKDVKQELVAQGRSDLAGISEALEGAETSNQNIYTRIIDDEHPITREEIQQEIVPNLESVDAIDDVLAEAAIDNDILIHASSREDLTEMIHATREAGVDLYITSGYRSFAYQLMTYLKPGNDESSVMQPGKSQHHTGLALDFTAEEIGFVVDEESGFEQSKAGIWLADNGWKYGYVQSYTKNHDGIVNEAWHYYYVGKEIAKIWHNSQQSQDPQDIFEILEQYQTGGIRSQ